MATVSTYADTAAAIMFYLLEIKTPRCFWFKKIFKWVILKCILYIGLYIIIIEGNHLMWRLPFAPQNNASKILIFLNRQSKKKTCPLQRKVPQYTNIYLSTYESTTQLHLVGNHVVYMRTFYWVPLLWIVLLKMFVCNIGQ